MKSFTFFLLLLGGFGIITSCQSGKIMFQESPSFSITEPYTQHWVGGQPGNSGFNLILKVSHIASITPDSLYFRNRISTLDQKPNPKDTLWVGRFDKNIRKALNLSEDPSGTLSEKVPEAVYFPFELQDDEAVLMYHENDQVYYFKIEGIVQKEPIYFPAARPKN